MAAQARGSTMPCYLGTDTYSVHSTGLEQSSCTPTPGRHTASASASVALPRLSSPHADSAPMARTTQYLRKLIVSE